MATATHTLLAAQKQIDANIKAAYEAANPGQLLPTEGVVTDGDEFEVDEGTITMNVADHVVTASFEASAP